MKNPLFFLLFLFLANCVFSQNILENSSQFDKLLSKHNVWGEKIQLGTSSKGKPIYAYYYNKGGSETAMVLAGVHGSEFYGVDVAYEVKKRLDQKKVKKSKWKILLIPELFPDNVEKGRNHPFSINYGRKTCEVCHGQDSDCSFCSDPNRQMPCINTYFKPGDTLSCFNEKIETENQILLYLTQKFNPDRTVSIHCKNSSGLEEIGIYADPKTGVNNTALGFQSDAFLALEMAFKVKERGGTIFGNFINEKIKVVNDSIEIQKVSYLNPIYPQDPPANFKGENQIRSYETNGGKVTYGTWASSEIRDGNKRLLKKAATLITVEMPQFYYFFDEKDNPETVRLRELKQNTSAYADAITEVFLKE